MERCRISLICFAGHMTAPVIHARFARKKIELCDSVESVCDKAADHAPVMLHLRACHASKAAILTIPARSLPVENRSPA